MDELDLSKIKAVEVVAEEETEEWEFVSKLEAGVDVTPYISFPKMHEVGEEVDLLLDKISTESDGQKELYSNLNQESGREIEEKQEKIPESVRRKENNVRTAMDKFSLSKPFQLEKKDTEITREKEGFQQNFLPHKLEEKASARKVETVEGQEYLQKTEQKNEMLRKQLVGPLKNIFKEDPDCGRLRRELGRALRDDEYDSEIEKIRKLVETLRDASPRDRDNGRLRREMIEALQVSTQSDQGNERSNLEMVEVPKDVSQCDKESEWLRREIMEAMQGELFYHQESEKFKREMVEVPTAAPKYVQGSKKEGRCIVLAQKDGLTHEERVWLRKEWIEAMQDELTTSDLEDELPGKETVEAPKAASKNDQGSESLGREMIEALKEESQSDKERELLKREVVEALQDASHFQQYKERVRREIREAKRIAAQFEEENERVKRVIDEAMQDLSQSFTKSESELSQSEKEKEMSEIATNERFARDLKLREIKSFTLSQNVSQARQGNTSTQSKTPPKLQIKATGNESSPKRAVDSDFVELFLPYFKCNLKVSGEVATESENSDGEKDSRVKISKDSVSFKNKNSPSSDKDESKGDDSN